MKYLAESHNVGDPTPYLAEETERVHALLSGRRAEWCLLKSDYSGAVLLLDADDLPAAQALVDDLPLVAHGITSFTFTEVVRFS